MKDIRYNKLLGLLNDSKNTVEDNDNLVKYLLNNGIMVPVCKEGDLVYTIEYRESTNQYILCANTVIGFSSQGLIISASQDSLELCVLPYTAEMYFDHKDAENALNSKATDLLSRMTVLYRGRRFDNNEWAEGDLITYPDGTVYIHGYEYHPGENGGVTKVEFTHEVQLSTVGLFSGLYDINRRKIFTHDIHSYAGRLYVVKYGSFTDVESEDDLYGWYMEDLNTADRYSFTGHESEYVNIIGTVFDNHPKDKIFNFKGERKE